MSGTQDNHAKANSLTNVKESEAVKKAVAEELKQVDPPKEKAEAILKE